MTDPLTQLEHRIKGARRWSRGALNRLYIPYGKRGKGIKTSTWIEVINDALTIRVKVEQPEPGRYDHLAQQYIQDLREQFHELLHDCELKRKEVPLHERLRDEIYPVYSEDTMLHQANAVRFMCSMKVSALFADTGTGKTKMSLDVAHSRYEAGQITKVLVFCPVSTKKNFREEIEKWHSGSPIDWKIIGLESMSQSDRTYLQVLEWVDSETMIIVDESHNCKNPVAKRSKRIMQCSLKTSYKLIMTGTPTENVRDIYMQYSLLSELIIGCKSWLQFEEKYLIMGGINRDEVIGHKNIDHLMSLLEPYTFQVSAEECLDLPAKTIQRISCSLNEDQVFYYEKTKQSLLDELEKWEEPPAHIIFRHFTILQQICCGFYADPDEDGAGDLEMLGTNKLDLLDRFTGSQCLFFAKYLAEIDIIVKHLGRDNCAIFTGQNPKEREVEKELFTSGHKQFFVATMASGGTGLNGLQHCQNLVFFSNSFRWVHRKQSIGRIDRKGQTKPMFIYDLVTRSGMDNRIMENLARKGNLADEIKEKMKDKTELKKYILEL